MFSLCNQSEDMSPHAVTPQDGFDDLLASFNVTKNGFLPADEPIKRITNPYYEAWELLIHNLQALLARGTLRQRIQSIPLLSTEHLRSEAEWRRAYVILTLLTHSYIWGGEKAAEVSLHQPSLSTWFRAHFRKYEDKEKRKKKEEGKEKKKEGRKKKTGELRTYHGCL